MEKQKPFKQKVKKKEHYLYEIDKDGVLTLNPHMGQAKILTMPLSVRFILMLGGSQAGKSLKDTEEIPTPDGFILLKDIHVGHTVYGADGKPCKVIFESPTYYDRECFTIEFSDGSVIVADGEHNWSVKTYKARKNERRVTSDPNPSWSARPQCHPPDTRYSVVTTMEMYENQFSKKRDFNYSIDLPLPVEYPERDLPISPYTFGVWLGDGTSAASEFTKDERDYEIIDRVRSEYPFLISSKNRSRSTTHYLSGDGNKFLGNLKSLGVYKNKHIPEIYKTASVSQRWELLRGLMDTDGYCGKRGHLEYTTIREDFALDVMELVRSLGIKVNLSVGDATIAGRFISKKYRVRFYSNKKFFYLTRKQERVREVEKPNTNYLYVRKITKCDSVPVKCIAVDNPNHLFLVSRSYIPTHNTSFGPWWLNYEIERMGSGDYIAATTNYDMFKLKMLPEIRRVYEDVLKIGRYWPGIRIMELRDPTTGKFLAKKADDKMWARIILRSAESPEGMEGLTGKSAWLDEVGMDSWDVIIWEALQRRLALSQGRVLGTTTVYASGWIKSEWYDRWLAGDPEYGVVQFDSIENPSFPRAEYDRAQRTLPTYKFNMFYRGMFDKPPGLILGDFTDQMLVDFFGFDKDGSPIIALPRDWPVVVGLDFGGANTATLWLTKNPDTDVVYAFWESLEGDIPTSEHADKVAKRAGIGITRCGFYGGSKGETQIRMDWWKAGIPVREPIIADVEAGISRIIELIKMDKFRAFRSLAGLRHELNTYKRVTDEAGNTTDEIEHKNRFHRIDCLRYGVPAISEGMSNWDDVKDLGRREGTNAGTFDTDNRFAGDESEIMSPFRM